MHVTAPQSMASELIEADPKGRHGRHTRRASKACLGPGRGEEGRQHGFLHECLAGSLARHHWWNP